MTDVSIPCDPIAFGVVSFCRTMLMGQPKGVPYGRSAEFRLPRFRSAPSVSVNVQGIGAATPLAVYSLKINDDIDGKTQIAIEAQSLDKKGLSDKPVRGIHFCNIVVTGVTLNTVDCKETSKSKPRRKAKAGNLRR